jgi:hypothetical protein
MSRKNWWRGVIGGTVALVFVFSAWFWHTLGWGRFDDKAFQLRLSQWGGRSQPLPRDSSLAPFRRTLGDSLYLELTGSMGRVVGAHRPGASREQLADLLTVQPICSAYLSGREGVDDEWLAGIRDRAAMLGLFLDGTGVTDRSCDPILEMKKLRELSLCDTAISDEAVVRLLKLPALQRLIVGGPNVRAIQIVDYDLVETPGLSGIDLSIRGHVAVSGLPGTPGKIHVMVRTQGDPPPWESVPYGWNVGHSQTSVLVEDSPGNWSFDVPVANVPTGQSQVEVWVESASLSPVRIVQYRLTPFGIDLAPSADSQIARRPGSR